ncbi:MAG: DUF6531 domain-containing protein, partial [Actinobacteria bacterium]|nr:DUF6531 domain-containing protein [Actinomycetota bacterium]
MRDRVTGAVERDSVDSSGTQANDSSSHPAISADGRWVAFDSVATNLVSGDTNGQQDVFLHDRQLGTTIRVSVSSSGVQGSAQSNTPSVSADGRYTVFGSFATNLVSGDTNSLGSDEFEYDGTTATTIRVTTTSSGAQVNGNNGSIGPTAVSGDGRYVAFSSKGGFTPGVTGLHLNVFVKDVVSGGVTRISGSGSQGNGDSDTASISPDGKYVSFSSAASDLITGDTNAVRDVFRADVATDTIVRVSVDSAGNQANGASNDISSMSATGRYVGFHSAATNLDSGFSANGSTDLYVRDMTAGTTPRVDVSTSGTQTSAGSDCLRPLLSQDGRYVVFDSTATNLVGGDTNGQPDVFLRDRSYVVPDKQTYGLSGAHGANPSGSFAEPVDTSTGNYSTTVTDASLPGLGLPFVFARSYNSLDTTTGPLGLGWTHTYNASLSIAWDGSATLRAEEGQQLVFTKQANGSFTGDPGARSTLTAIVGGYDLKRQDQIDYTFDSTGRLTKLQDRSGNAILLTYTSNQLTSLTDTSGRSITLGYTSGLLTSLTLPDSRSVSYAYTSGNLTGVTDLNGNTTHYGYDSSNRLTTITDQAGRVVLTNTYDSTGRISDQADVFGNHTTFAWNPTTQTATMTDADSKVWKDVYANGFLAQRTDPFTKHMDMAYDTGLNPTQITDRLGNVWQLSFDSRGNLLSRQAPSPLSFTQSWTYDARNNPLTYTDGRNNLWQYQYDASGRLTKETQPDSSFRTLTYTASGQLATSSDFLGHTTSYTYDANGNLTQIQTPLGHKSTFTYDAAGRVLTMVEARGNEPGGVASDYTTTYTYDSAGHVLTLTDPLGNVTTNTY